MYDNQVQALAKEIAAIKKERGKSPRYPEEIWKRVVELCSHFSVPELSQRLGLSISHIKKKVAFAKIKTKRAARPDSPMLVSVPNLPPQANAHRPPVLEMELPSGAKIRIFS